jgi:hypothetical protein
MIAFLAGCSSDKPASETKKAVPTQKIQGRIQVLVDTSGQTATGDATLNAGGPSAAYMWVGPRRYRLFTRTAVDVSAHGHEYVAEGYDAQKMIDEIGDPNNGANGYPLQASCEKVIRTAWPGLAFDETESKGSLLRARISRYPARPVFLVVKIEPAPAEGKDAKKAEKETKTVAVPADKQKAMLEEGAVTQTAPLFEPAGGTVKCKVVIDPEGKVSELETGQQLCEYVQWSQFKFKPTMAGGKAVNVQSEVEIKFEPRK